MDPLEDARREQERLSRVMDGDHSDDEPEHEGAPHPTPAPEDAGGGEGAGLLP